jgi:hypothetical protein
MLFNLKNIGAMYHRAMDLILYDMINHNIEVYINDIMVKSMSQANHLSELDYEFKCMKLHNLKINSLKYALYV